MVCASGTEGEGCRPLRESEGGSWMMHAVEKPLPQSLQAVLVMKLRHAQRRHCHSVLRVPRLLSSVAVVWLNLPRLPEFCCKAAAMLAASSAISGLLCLLPRGHDGALVIDLSHSLAKVRHSAGSS